MKYAAVVFVAFVGSGAFASTADASQPRLRISMIVLKSGGMSLNDYNAKPDMVVAPLGFKPQSKG